MTDAAAAPVRSAATEAYADPADPALPTVDMTVDTARTALVVTDPQVDCLVGQGVARGVVGECVEEQSAVETIERLLAAAKASGIPAFTSPHKVCGSAQNDLNLQLGKRGIDKVILAGMAANLCTQAHLYELLELGYEVAVVRDATAGAKVPEDDGYLEALVNFRMVANAVWWTDEAVARMQAAA